MKKYDPETVEMFELRLYDKNKSGKYWSWKYKRVDTNLSSFIVDGDIIFSGNEKMIQTKAAKEHHGIENDDILAEMIVFEVDGSVTVYDCVDWSADVLDWKNENLLINSSKGKGRWSSFMSVLQRIVQHFLAARWSMTWKYSRE